jgi:hypothetical protein
MGEGKLTLIECAQLKSITVPGQYLAQYKGVSIEVVVIGFSFAIWSKPRQWFHYLNVETSDVFLLPVRKTFAQYLEELP